MRLVIEAAAKMGVPFFNTFMAATRRRRRRQRETALEVWPQIVNQPGSTA